MTESSAPRRLAGIIRPTVSALAAVRFLRVREGWRGQARASIPRILAASCGEKYQYSRGYFCRFHPPEQLLMVFSGASKRAEGLLWTCFKLRKFQRS